MALAAKLPKYKTYKDSGVAWLGDIPDSWKTEKAKWLFNKVDRPVRKIDEIVTCFRDGEVTLRSNRRTDGFTNALKEHGYQGIRKGDLVIHAMDAFAGSIGVSDSDGKSTPVYSACVPRIRNTVNPYFYAYYMRDLALSGYIVSLAKGIRERSTDFRFNDFSELLLPFPSLEEQTAIANFLDKKTTQIDEAIAIKQQQIELLRERKQIIIQQAVTRGLDPDVPMKDSDVEWIGEIPVHWECRKIKHHIDILSGYAFKSGEYTQSDNDIKLLRGVNVNPDSINWTDVVTWSRDKVNHYEKYKLENGDLVIGMDRPWVSSGVRVAQISKQDLPALLLQRVARIRGKNEMTTSYVKRLLSTPWFLYYFEPMLTGISVPHISTDQIEGFECPIPPLTEQIQILHYLKMESEKIDGIIATQQDQIERLQEYKTTLINSAVTGKIKVPTST